MFKKLLQQAANQTWHFLILDFTVEDLPAPPLFDKFNHKPTNTIDNRGSFLGVAIDLISPPSPSPTLHLTSLSLPLSVYLGSLMMLEYEYC